MSTEMTAPDLISISGFASLYQAGINALGFEACPFRQRLACDVNAAGLALLAEYFGALELRLPPPKGASVNGAPAIGSILLGRDAWQDLARYWLFKCGALACHQGPAGLIVGLFTSALVAQFSSYDRDLLENYALSGAEAQYGAAPLIPPSGHIY